MSCHHEIAPLPENMVSGYLDAAVAPVLKIASGDTVRLTSWAAADVQDRRTAHRSDPRRGGAAGRAGDDRAHLPADLPCTARGLHAVLACGRSARDADRRRVKGCHMMLAKSFL
jgi:hypothetical protein